MNTWSSISSVVAKEPCSKSQWPRPGHLFTRSVARPCFETLDFNSTKQPHLKGPTRLTSAKSVSLLSVLRGTLGWWQVPPLLHPCPLLRTAMRILSLDYYCLGNIWMGPRLYKHTKSELWLTLKCPNTSCHKGLVSRAAGRILEKWLACEDSDFMSGITIVYWAVLGKCRHFRMLENFRRLKELDPCGHVLSLVPSSPALCCSPDLSSISLLHTPFLDVLPRFRPKSNGADSL